MSSDLEARVRAIEERNLRVEADKAWEVSACRRVSITLATYIIALIGMQSLGTDHPAWSALIPSGGYLLSTLSLPFLKSWWLRGRR